MPLNTAALPVGSFQGHRCWQWPHSDAESLMNKLYNGKTTSLGFSRKIITCNISWVGNESPKHLLSLQVAGLILSICSAASSKILSFHMENQQWVTENKAIHTGLVSCSSSSTPQEFIKPISWKGLLNKIFLPHQEVRSSSNVSFSSLQEGRHVTANRSRWSCWQFTLHHPTGLGGSPQPPLSSPSLTGLPSHLLVLEVPA